MQETNAWSKGNRKPIQYLAELEQALEECHRGWQRQCWTLRMLIQVIGKPKYRIVERAKILATVIENIECRKSIRLLRCTYAAPQTLAIVEREEQLPHAYIYAFPVSLALLHSPVAGVL